MSNKKKPTTKVVENTSDEKNPPTPTETKSSDNSIKYVVVRDGFRVEDREYDSPDDPVAKETLAFWTKVSQTHSWGEKTEIVPYDPKKHKVW